MGGCEEVKYNEITSYAQKRKCAIVVVSAIFGSAVVNIVVA